MRVLRYLIPYRTVTLESPYAPDEVAGRLAQMVEPWSGFRFWLAPSSEDKKFEGEVSERGFHISRLHGRFSRMPRLSIQGEIAPLDGGATISLVMRYKLYDEIVLGILFGIFLLATFWGRPRAWFGAGLAGCCFLISGWFQYEVYMTLEELVPFVASPTS